MNKSLTAGAATPEQALRLRTRLTAAAGHVTDSWSAHLAALEQRDTIIVEAYESGFKVREIAEHAGISPARIHSIIANS